MAENTPPPAHGLVKKLAEVMAHADRIPKLGRNTAQGYEYARASDVLAEVRKELANRFIFVSHEVTALEWRTLETKNGKVQIATVHMTLTAHDGETGQSLAFAKTIGEGMDYGDKQSGKALTGAMKYGILNGFMIPTGEDPENDAVPAPGRRSSSGRPSNEGTAGRGGATPSAPNSAPTELPTYGPSPKAPIRGADPKHLETYLQGARRTLANPEKARFHAKESALIGAIEAELARRRAAVPEGKRETATAPPPPAGSKPVVVEARPGETEETAKARAIYETACELIQRAQSLAQADKVVASAEGKVSAEHLVDLGNRRWKRKAEIQGKPPPPEDMPPPGGYPHGGTEPGSEG